LVQEVATRAYPSATEIKNHETYTKMEGLQ